MARIVVVGAGLGGMSAAYELRETLASNLEEVRRMTTIVNDMLFLAQADHGARVASALPPA